MSTFEILTEVEAQAIQLERARAVLSEAEHYFEDKKHTKYLPHYAEHVLLLLHVVDSLLYGMQPEVKKIVGSLLEQHKEKKQNENSCI